MCEQVGAGSQSVASRWGEDATGDEITNARDADRKTGTISPVEWARNADEMKAGKNGETFVLPSRSLYKSL